MSPAEFIAMARELKELGVTKLAVSPDGAFEAIFANPPKFIPVQQSTPELEPERREPRIKTPEEAPTNAEGRQAWREDVMKSVIGG